MSSAKKSVPCECEDTCAFHNGETLPANTACCRMELEGEVGALASKLAALRAEYRAQILGGTEGKALSAALSGRGDGGAVDEPVAWAVYDARGVLINVCRHYSNAESEVRAWNDQGRVPESDKPFRLVPLHAHPPRAEERDECVKALEALDELAVAADWDEGDAIAAAVKKACNQALRARGG